MSIVVDPPVPELHDSRLEDRYLRIFAQAQARPDQSFPRMVRSEAELEALYRFFRNPKVDFEGLLTPHVRSTIERCSGYQELVVAHDTTELRFKGDPYEQSSRTGLGHLTGKGQGFFLHAALVMTPDMWACPLGLLGAEAWARTKKKAQGEDQAVHRWGRLARTVTELMPKCRLIHVMDREADIYSVFDSISKSQDGFVIRARHNRKLFAANKGKLFDALIDVEPITKREIRIASRVAKGSQDRRRSYPTRKGRQAKVEVRAASAQIARTKKSESTEASLVLNYLHLYEPNPPLGEPAVDWKLLTTEPIDTAADVERVIDIYRKRWLIEEFFKALKTGCAVEKRQLESLNALKNATAMMLPIAWNLLAIRAMKRRCPDIKATQVFSDVQLKILRKLSSRPPPEDATLKQAFDALAAFAGHIKNNGEPGWAVLGRGYQELIQTERIWRTATSDQS